MTMRTDELVVGEAEARARIDQYAPKQGGGFRGLLARARFGIWRKWLWLVSAAAAANWKQWLAVLALGLAAFVALISTPKEESPKYGLDHEFSIDSPEFIPTLAGATDTSFETGNTIETFNNGDEFYPPMLEAIASAKQTVTIEAYIYWKGEIGQRFAEALAAKAREGVSVKILLDAVGSSTIGDEILENLKSAGCEVKWYRPVKWYTLDRVNHRTHRKSIIIDGRIGFTGGAGIADHWLGNAQDKDHWRDIQVRIEGPAVVALQTGFARNWLETTGELVSGDRFYPAPSKTGPLMAQSILSSPETGSSNVRTMYYLAIVCARKSIFIANPYFIPDEEAIEALVEAKKRGVDVKIMAAGIHNDNALARYNSVRLYGALLDAGIEIYEYNRTMMHHKYMVCDGIWTTIGTTNFDNRSFALNEENNLGIYDRGFAAKYESIFINDISACDRIDTAKWHDRGIVQRAKEIVVGVLREQV